MCVQKEDKTFNFSVCNWVTFRTKMSRNRRTINLMIFFRPWKSLEFNWNYRIIQSLVPHIWYSCGPFVRSFGVDINYLEISCNLKMENMYNPWFNTEKKMLKNIKNWPNLDYLFLFLSITSTNCQSCLQTTTWITVRRRWMRWMQPCQTWRLLWREGRRPTHWYDSTAPASRSLQEPSLGLFKFF